MKNSSITLLFILLFFFNNLFASFSAPQSITIYWDSSLSLKNRDIEKELQFLDSFFKLYSNSEVKLITFNTSKVSEDLYTISSSNWDLLYKKINNIIYDGASDFSLVDIGGKEDLLLFFTDGKSNLGNIDKKLYTPRIITISSVKDVNKRLLHETAYYNNGYYIDLLSSDVKQAVQSIYDNKVLSKLQFVNSNESNENYISGIVEDEAGLLGNVDIEIKNKNIKTITDVNGVYHIKANPADTLMYSYTNKKTVILTSGNAKVINVKLQEKSNKLDTVFIMSEKKDTEVEKVIIGDRIVEKRSLGYAVQNISDQNISPDEVKLGEALAGKFSGVVMGNNNDSSQMIIRGFSSIQGSNHPLFIIDGVPISRNSGLSAQNKSRMDFVDPSNIADITVLKGLAATNRYGSLGSNGVVIVTTKTYLSNYEKSNRKEEKKKKIKYNRYNGALEFQFKKKSIFIEVLENYNNVDMAYEHFISFMGSNTKNIMYFLDSASYFFDKKDFEKGIQVLSNLVELYPNDTSVLRVLAFNLEKYSLLEYAEKIYKRILHISPNDTQNYLDLANNYYNNKKYQKSVDLFNKMSNNKIKDIHTFNGLNSQINNDFKNLLSNRNQTWNLKNVNKSNFLLPKYKLRVVTEWSHPQTEFEIQYINPEKHFFTLSHTKESNKNALNTEMKEGFLSDEYVLSDLKSGKWFLNLIVPEKQVPNTKYPRYLKIEVYTEFGFSNQKKQTHLINLDTVDGTKIFASFDIK
ncbi:lipopolysaccharide assembly protein LapB [uncultured Aquimarina sp.]|uniref:tetratricopeptide repeat protein n=1 Tax=uncultured Aquimarina sp. TaxID=575652 RepID=UPI002625B6E0|nr:TonB-dependent receptor plug domain-containing protein [uncultured Aquimarina sp.]